jgi:hypothetical protein
MTIFAGGRRVRAVQHKNPVVVKICQPVAAVVTFQATVAKLLAVFGHKGGVGVAVAGDAIQLLWGKAIHVAIAALHCRAVIILLVARQAKISQPFVIKANQRQLGNVRFAPFVVGVAMLAAAGIR